MTTNGNGVNLSEINFTLQCEHKEYKHTIDSTFDGGNSSNGENSRYNNDQNSQDTRNTCSSLGGDRFSYENTKVSNNLENFKEIDQTCKGDIESGPRSNNALFKKMRWTNLDCSKTSLHCCFRRISSKINKHGRCCIYVLAAVVVVLLVIIIILSSLLSRSWDKTELGKQSKMLCDVEPCLNNGTCITYDGLFSCECLDGFSGRFCENTPCTHSICLHGGSCVIDGSKNSCQCLEGFYGEQCEVTPCTHTKCQNGGQCHIVGSSFRCACHAGTSGILCEESPCSKFRCLNAGTCLFMTNRSTCACPFQFYGEACENMCEYGATSYGCTFETIEDNCFLTDAINDNFNWTINTGPTPTKYTGPNSAFEGLYYMYIEASPPTQEGYIARLVSKVKFSTCIRCLRFSYHMYGAAVGHLSVYHGDIKVWTQSGDQGDTWKMEQLEIEGAINKSITFEAIRGKGVTSDIAIDDVWLFPGKCV